MKLVKETEAIKVYIMKDENVRSGVMWKIEPPFSWKKKFEEEYSNETTWAENEKELMEVINEITGWKLSKS